MIRARSQLRGQAMVLFCLTLLLLTLMVLMTLQISTKVKDKMEAQNVADAAAYSEAVVTARSFNEFALLNRAQVSHQVALATVQALISWSGEARAMLAATNSALQNLSCGAGDTPVNNALNAVAAREAAIQSQWDKLDQAAGDQQRGIMRISEGIYDAELVLLDYNKEIRTGAGGTQTLSEKIAQDARAGSPWKANVRDLFVDKNVMGAAGYPSQVEMAGAVPTVAGGGVWSAGSLYATMGTRRDTFTTLRTSGQVQLQALVDGVLGNNGISSAVTNTGNSYFTNNQGAGPSPTGGNPLWIGSAFGFGEDHGTLSLSRPNSPCGKTTGTPAQQPNAMLFSTDLMNTTDVHDWSPSLGPPDNKPAQQRHTYDKCTICPAIWPGNMVYGEGSPDVLTNNATTNVWGQPKNIVVVQRDLSVRDARPDPWQLSFSYQFSPSETSPAVFSLKKENASAVNPRMMAALASGIVYYHRGSNNGLEHWKEPPNFLNPFWRATLIGSDVDETGASRGQSDIDALNQHGNSLAAQSIQALKANGFRGLQ